MVTLKLKLSEMMNCNSSNKKILLSRRAARYGNEIFKEAAERTCATYTDRFIPLKRTMFQMDRNLRFYSDQGCRDILCLGHGINSTMRQDILAVVLQLYFGIENRRIFHYNNLEMLRLKPNFENLKKLMLLNQDWACMMLPKRKVYREEEHQVLQSCESIDSNSTDWSVNNDFAMVGDNCVKIWCRSQKYTMSMKAENTRALAYSPNGDLLTVGCELFGNPELWKFCLEESDNTTTVKIEERKFLSAKYESVSCLEWLQNGKQVACGTDSGDVIIFFAPELEIRYILKQHGAPIKLIRFSPNMEYMATGSMIGVIVIYTVAAYETYLQVKSGRTLDIYFDWHPWNGTDLAISEYRPPSLVILHVPSRKIVAYYQRRGKNISINTISFNKITAELLVSITEFNQTNEEIENKILVLSSLQTLVTEIGNNNNRFIRWNVNGTQMMTSCDDDIIRLWSFYQLPRPKHDSSSKIQHSFKEKLVFEKAYGNQFKKYSTIR